MPRMKRIQGRDAFLQRAWEDAYRSLSVAIQTAQIGIYIDIDDARVYGGIHFRFDQEEAAEQGCRVGAYIYKNNLRRVREDSCDEENASTPKVNG